MTQNQAREAVYERWRAGWAASAYASVPYAFDNDLLQPEPDQAHVRLVMRHSASEQYSLGRVGNRRVQRQGMVLIEIYAPGPGTQYADRLSTAARDIFEMIQNAEEIEYLAAAIREEGFDGLYYKVALDVPVQYLEVK